MTMSWMNRAVMMLIVATIATIVITNVVLPASSGFALDGYTLTLIGKYLCYALLALALDLVWGYCGILSLGHAAFFALGGYAMGMYLMRQIGDRGMYGNADLPDFMVFLNWDALPWYWLGSDSVAWPLIMAWLIPGLLALIFGWFAFRSRVSGVYLSIITQALTYALMLAFFMNELGFGGNNGLTDFKEIFGAPITAESTRVSLVLLTAMTLLLALYGSQQLMQTKYGRVLISIRDSEARSRFLGYRVEHYKLSIFVLSAMLAGIAGALYVPQVGIINPGEFSPLSSIEVVVWVALGGRGSLFGAAIGAVLVNFAKTLFTGFYPEAWLFFLGAIFVISTLYLPKGLIGLFEDVMARQRGRAKNLESLT
ncbi:MAG: urea ABC transporter permease subunit UrtC [Gammaproteobacteria bacterium]|nr:urea ABC transporter permease subunit UrtC [Gammaproteobacteria bacterium]